MLLTEQLPQTTLAQATHRDAAAATSGYPSTSIIASSPLSGCILVPQSSQLVWPLASARAAFSMGGGSMSGTAAGEGMFQKAWRDFCPEDRGGAATTGCDRVVRCDSCSWCWGDSWCCCWAEYSIFNVCSAGTVSDLRNDARSQERRNQRRYVTYGVSPPPGAGCRGSASSCGWGGGTPSLRIG